MYLRVYQGTHCTRTYLLNTYAVLAMTINAQQPGKLQVGQPFLHYFHTALPPATAAHS